MEVERLADVLKLSQASGIPVETLAAQTIASKSPSKGNESCEGD
jgi:hypothetical protein